MAVRAVKSIHPSVIFHIARKSEWDAAVTAGAYAADSLHTEGFIHCSTLQQVIATADRLFGGRRDLVLLSIATDRIQAEIRHENLEGGENLFPHIYGDFAPDAVIAVHDFQPRDDGSFDLPQGLGSDAIA